MKVTVQSKEERGGEERRGREGEKKIKKEREGGSPSEGAQLFLCKLSHPLKIGKKKTKQLFLPPNLNYY